MNKNDKYSNEKIIIKKAGHYKLLSSIIEGDRFFNFTDGLVKLTKYDLQKRAEILTRLYRNFFISGVLIQDAKMEAYQNHYESFMHNDVRDEAKYSEILAECIENQNYLYTVSAIRHINELIGQGLDISKLPSKNKQFVERTLQLKNDCGFDKDFSYDEFYRDNQVRRSISQKINYYMKDVENIKATNEEEGAL